MIRRLVSLLSVAALCTVLPLAALASDGGGKARAAGVCGRGVAAELRLESDHNGIRLRFEVDHGRPGAAWRVVLVHERRIAWKGKVSARRDGSFEVRRTLRDLSGADTVTARAVGPGGLVCLVAATLAGEA